MRIFESRKFTPEYVKFHSYQSLRATILIRSLHHLTVDSILRHMVNLHNQKLRKYEVLSHWRSRLASNPTDS